MYKSYGNLAIDYQTVSQPLRLPRQYFDEESGLHYNRYRYYDHTVHVTLVKTRLV
ncbi:RHS repeat-associated core domain-containing protein [Gilliamella sp. W8136]|uniref:RHS repeat-associated core domain-containing protein n=1 Tax=Gilliamella TaxID=1193503 RepID=UPI00351CB1F4